MRHLGRLALLACATILTSPALGAPAKPAPLSTLVGQVALPYTKFQLANGLTVLVHEDHKAPVVAVNVWYNVGSKDEPKGKTGYAHLYEHLMFYGSDNVRQPIMPFLEKIGATDWNGTTWFDRTNYFETVPKGELEKALFMESDLMGYLLPALDQKRLDLQRGVVQNEKRQDDNQPEGLVEYAELENLFPVGHPYHHSTIGSMHDLDRASLADVKQWFIDKYGPNNAVVALAGDITPAEARTLMEKYFGAIKRGPVNIPASASVPTLPAAKRIVMKDRVAATDVQLYWAVPGMLSPQSPAVKVGATILGGLSSSRFDKILVRGEKIAVSASANVASFHRVGMFEISAVVKPGVDPALVEKRVKEVIADYIAHGPTADEVRRAATVAAAGEIRALEKTGQTSGQAGTLASGQLYAGDPQFYRKQLNAYAALTPATVQAAMKRWLSRPVLEIVVEPGDRPPYEESAPVKQASGADIPVPSVKRVMPEDGPPVQLDFPTIERTTLSNGLKLTYAQRTGAPLTHVLLSFNAGMAADNPGARGLQNMTMALLDEGTTTRTSQQIAEDKERLGANLTSAGGIDRSAVGLSALTPNLAASLELMTDVVEHPAFADNDIERIRSQLLTEIAQAKTDPNSMAARELPVLLFGPTNPYGGTQLGSDVAVKSFTRAQLLDFKDRWLRPDNAELFVVSDLPLAELKPQLEAAFAGWKAPAVPRGTKAFTAAAARPTAPRIVLLDRPGSPQSVIYAGELTPVNPRSDITPFDAGTTVLGGSTASRINQDLREQKSWSYGAFGGAQLMENATPFFIVAPVQADRTGDSVAELVQQLKGITTTNGVTAPELQQAVATQVKALPGEFETGSAVLGAMAEMAMFHRPDNYYETLPAKYRALDTGGVDQALRGAIDPNAITFVVVGDAAKVRPQLDKLGIPIQVAEAP